MPVVVLRLSADRRILLMTRQCLRILSVILAALFVGSCDGPTTPEPVDPDTIPKPREVVEEDYVVLPNGLKYYDFKEGTGEAAKVADQVAVHYHGWLLTDSTLFDSSFLREEPFEFIVGSGIVIQGWDEGVIGMRENGERQLVIPPELAYGATGRANIPPNSTLIFELWMVQINL